MLPFIENSAREEKVFYSRAEYFLLAVRKYSVRGHNFFCMDCSLKMSGLFFENEWIVLQILYIRFFVELRIEDENSETCQVAKM